MMPEDATVAATIDADRTVLDTSPPQSRAWAPGGRFGRFQLSHLLGKGGMGEVYAAEDPVAQRVVALKVLHDSLESSSSRDAFLKEGRIASSIRHPRSVFIFSAEEVEGRPTISMELLTGGTLADRLRANGPLPATEVVPVLLDLIDGLDAALKAGILHRDIKPSNCFVEANGRVKIGDFGISQAAGQADSTTPSGRFSGTPAYASPEQLHGRPLDVRSDIYSLGATAYALLTGTPPFEFKSLDQIRSDVTTKPVLWPSKGSRSVPKPLIKTVLKCLAKDPDSRFQNYRELRTALAPETDHVVSPAARRYRIPAFIVDGWISGVSIGILIFVGTFTAIVAGLPVGNDNERQSTLGVWIVTFVSFALQFLYFWWFEQRYGATWGKRFLKLRVVAVDGSPATRGQLAIRTLVFLGSQLFVQVVGDTVVPLTPLAETSPELLESMDRFYVILAVLLLFTRRSISGHQAGWHEILSGTRVVRREPMAANDVARKPLQRSSPPPLPDELAMTPPSATDRIGPFRVTGLLSAGYATAWRWGHDDLLNRRVFIRNAEPGEAAISTRRRQVNRTTRLRWVNGQRGVHGNWDAYEAVDGRPLSALMEQPMPWETVRFWIMGLAEELAAAESDGTLPDKLGLHLLWITPGNTIILLDESFEAGSGLATASTRKGDAHEFLASVLAALKEVGAGRRAAGSRDRADAPWPLHAFELEARFASRDSWESISQHLRSVLTKESSLKLLKRIQVTLTSTAIPGTLILFLLIAASSQHDTQSLKWVGLGFFGLWILPSLVTAGLLGRRGYTFKREELAIVDSTGAPAGRSRLLARALWAWLPALVFVAACCLPQFLGFEDALYTGTAALIGVAGTILAVVSTSMDRSLQDRLAGTWIVPE